MKQKVSLSEFDAADYLDSPEMIAAYLRVAFEENDAALIRMALNECLNKAFERPSVGMGALQTRECRSKGEQV